MNKIVELNGISSFEELMGNSRHLVQLAVNNGWFPEEPELEVEICDHAHIEGDALDVVQFTAHHKDQNPLIPLVVNASINQCKKGKLSLVPISVLDIKSVEYFSRQISMTEEIFDGVISNIKTSINLIRGLSWGFEAYSVGTAFCTTYKRNNCRQSEIHAQICSEQCFVEQNELGLWVPVRHQWN